MSDGKLQGQAPRSLVSKLEQALGEEITLQLVRSEALTGTVVEFGQDYLVLHSEGHEYWIPLAQVAYLKRPLKSRTSSQAAKNQAAKPSNKTGRLTQLPALKIVSLPPPPAPLTADDLNLKPFDFMPEPMIDTSRWHPKIADQDLKDYHALLGSLATLENQGGTPDGELIAQATRLCDRHPSQKDLQALLGFMAWLRKDDKLARKATLKASALGKRSSWRAFVHACLRGGRMDLALFGLGQISKFNRQDQSTLEAAQELAGHAIHSPGSESPPSFDFDDAEALESCLCQDGPVFKDARKPIQVKERYREFVEELARIQAEAKFADLEEDVNGLIADAEELFAHGKLLSAFDKINEGFQLVPGHIRLRQLEERLRGNELRTESSFDLARLEATLNYVLNKHDFVLFDTSVLSMQDTLSYEEASLDELLRASGAHGITTIEERVAYHKLVERIVQSWPKKVLVTDGVITEIHKGATGMKDRKAQSSFGKSALIMARALAPCAKNYSWDRDSRKRLRTLRSTFQKLRTKGGLSEVDYELICTGFVVGENHSIALLTNDRGIHRGVEHIKTAFQNGNRNIKFLNPDNVSVYTSLHKSHFELLEGTRSGQ